ncbi:MAG: exodeoxyribonuclease VII large subunit [Candidatus Thermoplasmatota archaeon]|nr:exodeoxyribonuclease VII large subunit [Candidatus Thermoplasmatota archaeon]
MDEIEPTPVGEFVQTLRARLRSDDRNQHCLLKGEISQWKPYPSGHTYFSLRDDGGQINAVIWKGRCRIPDGIKDGQEVLIIGSVDLYPARGQLQIVVERIELIQKIGALEQQKQKLLLQLRQEGVLDRPRKSLPSFPKHLVIVTGKGSAALADMLQLSQSRWPGIRTTVVGVTVQGDRAAEEIVRGLAVARELSRDKIAESIGVPPCDVVIVGRGGGSPEDLWAFNLEPVARAISAMPIPVISAVGHESDILVSDLVADLRASTPSHAVECCIPLVDDHLAYLMDCEDRMVQGSLRQFSDARQQLEQLKLRLKLAPSRGLSQAVRQLERLGNDLQQHTTSALQHHKQRLAVLGNALQISHPKRVLERGYMMGLDDEGNVITSVLNLSQGQTVSLQFADGEADANIDNIRQHEGET